jgi:hypothetical protein
MLGIAAAVISLCPLILEPPMPEILSAKVYYAHQAEDSGNPYISEPTFFPVQSIGVYTISAEGQPVSVLWSDGVFCGELPDLLFRDDFETGTTERWSL